MDYGLILCPEATLKFLMMDFVTHSFSFHWNHVHYLWIICAIFISCLDSISTLLLTAPIHCRGPTGEQMMNAIFIQICSDKETNHLHCGWPEGE